MKIWAYPCLLAVLMIPVLGCVKNDERSSIFLKKEENMQLMATIDGHPSDVSIMQSVVDAFPGNYRTVFLRVFDENGNPVNRCAIGMVSGEGLSSTKVRAMERHDFLIPVQSVANRYCIKNGEIEVAIGNLNDAGEIIVFENSNRVKFLALDENP